MFNEKTRLLLKQISFPDSESLLYKTKRVPLKDSLFSERNYFMKNESGFLKTNRRQRSILPIIQSTGFF
jgi:hypothetical protein